MLGAGRQLEIALVRVIDREAAGVALPERAEREPRAAPVVLRLPAVHARSAAVALQLPGRGLGRAVSPVVEEAVDRASIRPDVSGRLRIPDLRAHAASGVVASALDVEVDAVDRRPSLGHGPG